MYECNVGVIMKSRFGMNLGPETWECIKYRGLICNAHVIERLSVRLNHYNDQETRYSTKGSTNSSASRLREGDEFVLLFQGSQSCDKRRLGPGHVHKNLELPRQRGKD